MGHPNSKNKILTDYSDQELLQNLQDNPNDLVVTIDPIINFISKFSLKQGNYLVNDRVLYTLYKNTTETPITKGMFNNKLSQFLPFKGMDPRYYLLNKETLQISDSILKFLEVKKDKTKSPNSKRHFEKFLDFYNLKRGERYVEGVALYNIYDKWTYKNKNSNPLSYINFFAFCKIYFESKKLKNDVVYFGVSSNISRYINKATMTKLKKVRQQKYGKSKEKKQKK